MYFRSTPTSSPTASPVPSPRRPKLITRIDSIGGPTERQRISLFDNKLEENPDSSEHSSSAEEFGEC